ncbi:hypothetical protein OJAV_G00236880 [Oryzias javanicus]|uniref:Uncharacterized protein n=1 Tax=Oryzias javanicus TaxID=123683 RepID=A0A437BY29_ORYJA|nr:hypothetical protein OJAV_G00236880 [Oryzias javanicus]
MESQWLELPKTNESVLAADARAQPPEGPPPTEAARSASSGREGLLLRRRFSDGPDLSDTAVALLSAVLGDTPDVAVFCPESIFIIVENEHSSVVPQIWLTLLLFGYVYALDLQYPQKMELAMTFIQKVVMCLEDNKPLKGT